MFRGCFLLYIGCELVNYNEEHAPLYILANRGDYSYDGNYLYDGFLCECMTFVSSSCLL